MVLVGAVQVGARGGGRVVLRDAEDAALAQVVAAAHGQEGGVGNHAEEVRALVDEGVLEGVVVDGLDADLAEVGNLAAEVLGDADNDAAEVVDGARAGVGKVLQARDPVVGHEVGDLTALGVDPLDALADVEGVGEAVVAHGVAGGEARLLDALGVVLIEVVDEGGVVVEVAVAEDVPGRADAVEGGDGGVGEGVALAGEVLPGGVGIGAGAGELVPEVGERGVILVTDYLVGENHLVIVDAVAHPAYVATGAEGVAAHGVAAAGRVHRARDAALEELGLGDGHQGPALGQGLGRESLLVDLVEVAQGGHVDGFVVREDAALGRFGRRGGARSADDVRAGAAAGGQREHHGEAQRKG